MAPKKKPSKPDLRGYSTTSQAPKPIPTLPSAAAPALPPPAVQSEPAPAPEPAPAALKKAEPPQQVLRPPEKEGPSATAAILRLPFEHEEAAIDRLRNLNDDVFSTTPHHVPQRLWTMERVEMTYEALRDAGFDVADVEQAIEMVGPVAGDCFDWLSLNLPTTRLPKGWAAEGDADKMIKTKQVISVSVAKPRVAAAVQEEPSLPPSPSPSPPQIEFVPPKEEPKVDKEWIMRRYAEMDYPSSEEEEREDDSLERQLDELKQQYAACKLDQAERSRISSRIKDLSLELSQQQQIRRPQVPLQQQQPLPPPRAPSPPSLNLELLEDEEAIFSSPYSAPMLPLFEASLPPGWSAPLPRSVLADVAKRRMLDPPEYKPLCSLPRQMHYSVVVGGETYSVEQRCLTRAEACDLAATRALFVLCGGTQVNVRAMLPPCFRELWTEWEYQRERERRERVEQDEARRVEFAARVIELHRGRKLQPPLGSKQAPEGGGSQQSKAKRANVMSGPLDTSALVLNKVPVNLPINAVRDTIIERVRSNDALIVVGETGSGKTTQVPVYLLDDYCERKLPVRIAVAEPRRISATSVARRVSEELGDVPSLVGHAIRGESTVSEKRTMICFCTTGVLLRQLHDDPMLSGYSHVVVDEVHERSVDSDLLVVHLRRILRAKREPPLKVVLMSATVNAEQWSEYLDGAPVIKAQGRTFPVRVLHLDEAVTTCGYKIEPDSEYVVKQGKDWQTASLKVKGGKNKKGKLGFGDEEEKVLLDDGKVNLDLIESVLDTVCSGKMDEAKDGAVLVFLPGMADISRLYDRLSGGRVYGDASRFLLLMLHSALAQSSREQRGVFDVPPAGVRKIVLATNMAETGVTIPDVTVVVDTCRVNELDFDERRGGLAQLRERFVSKANAEQRAGRAGRVRAGVCFRLVYEQTWARLDARQAPEMLRAPLDDCVLRLLAQGVEPGAFLREAPEPPAVNAVNKALERLCVIGAAEQDEEGFRVTALGSHLARLPVEARLGKLLVLGSLFRCLDQVLTVCAAAGLAQSVFKGSEGRKHFVWGDSDLLTTCRAFEAWRVAGDGANQLAKRYQLNVTSLQAVKRTRMELLGHLRDAGLNCGLEGGEVREEVIAAVVLAGLYPQVASVELVRGPRPVADPAKDLRIVCCDGVEAFLHRGSVAFGPGKGPLRPGRDGGRERFLVFCERLKTWKVFLGEVMMIPPAALILFGGGVVEVTHAKRRVDVDGWHLRVPPRTAAVFSRCKVQLDRELVQVLEGGGGGGIGPAAQLALELILRSGE